jgi:hypothetical protein
MFAVILNAGHGDGGGGEAVHSRPLLEIRSQPLSTQLSSAFAYYVYACQTSAYLRDLFGSFARSRFHILVPAPL